MVFERKYSDEVKASSVQRVLERRKAEPANRAIFREVASEFEVGEQSLRQWVARIDDGSYNYRRRVPRNEAATTPASTPETVISSAAPAASDPGASARLRELEAQVETLRQEKDALVRALAIVTAQSQLK